MRERKERLVHWQRKTRQVGSVFQLRGDKKKESTLVEKEGNPNRENRSPENCHQCRQSCDRGCKKDRTADANKEGKGGKKTSGKSLVCEIKTLCIRERGRSAGVRGKKKSGRGGMIVREQRKLKKKSKKKNSRSRLEVSPYENPVEGKGSH